MDQKQLFRQILEFNKAAFDNNIKTLFLFQNQNAQYILRFLDKANWVPEEGKKGMNEWLNAYKKYSENFKVCADENYCRAMDYFTGPQTGDGNQDKNK